MKKDSQDLENQLTGKQAADLDEALLDRLEAAADGSLTQLSAEERKFEAQLRAIRPQSLSAGLLASLEAKVEGLPAPSQVRVLPFPGTQRIDEPELSRTRAPWMAAAAAVVLLGVLSAIWLDPMGGPGATAGNPTPEQSGFAPSPLPHSTTLPGAIPAEFTRALSETQDQGVIWPSNDEPHRVIKVTYTDRVTMKRNDGSTYEVEKPRVEYYLVPTESH